MCIAIIKEKGKKMPFKKTLRRCWDRNPDGAGFMHIREDKVTINKGFMTYKSLWKALQAHKFTEDDVVIIHLRKATAGGISPANCHPFPITGSEARLRQVKIHCNMAMVHNGVLGPGEGNLSDTMIFVRDVLASPSIHRKLKDPAINELIEAYIHGSRVAILEGNGTIHLYGDWLRDKKTGLLYSNGHYKPTKVKSNATRLATYDHPYRLDDTNHTATTPTIKKTPVVSRGAVTCDTCFVVLVGRYTVGDPIYRDNSKKIIAYAVRTGGWRCKRCAEWDGSDNNEIVNKKKKK
jgi:predicted glutamine amidotransferase